jgi:probable phosphoglycerate mutase
MKRPSKPAPPASTRLFSESCPSAPPAGVHTANIDGASRGNPGPASYAVVLRDPDGRVVTNLAKKLGRETNNVAEYFALLAALDYATTHHVRALRIRSDSELLVRQMQGHYKVKSADLKPLHERATKMARQLDYFKIEHVPREDNRDADALANSALDAAGISSQGRGATGVTSSARLSPSDFAGSQPPLRRLRARFEKGVFVPTEPADIPEGSEVTLDVQVLPKK